jgi:hypothetical protein
MMHDKRIMFMFNMTLKRYAQAVGCELQIKLVPQKA